MITPRTPLAPRAPQKFPRLITIPESELEDPNVRTVARLAYNSLAHVFHDPIGMILGSTFVLIMLWGFHGQLDLLGLLYPSWQPGVPRAQPGAVPWDQEWISFGAGFALLVLVPCALIKWVYRQDLRDYGLGPPKPGRWRLTLLSALVLLLISAPGFYFAARNPDMRATYPLYRGPLDGWDFVLYELGYLLFFVAIEFIFRGYLLFGLFHARDADAVRGTQGIPGPMLFGYYSILISMLSYTAWHLGKPPMETWGTLVWGIAAGAIALACGTIWHIIGVHWLLNVGLDWMILHQGK